MLGLSILLSFSLVVLLAQEAPDPPEDPVEEAAAVPAEESPPVFNQGTIPEALRQPQRGDESLRYPRDAVIGDLGRGLADEGAYRYARNLLRGILSGNRGSTLPDWADRPQLEELFTRLEGLNPQQYRLGGGREEADGATSFLFRFIGREKSLAGELYVRLEDDTWRLEDILVEEARALTERGTNTYKFDFSPYERFF